MTDTNLMSPQVVLFCEHVERAVAFYQRIGFTEVFRTPPTGTPKHVDLTLDGYRLGFASHEATRDDHDLATNRESRRAAVILWCHNTPAAYQQLLDAGAEPLEGPHEFLAGLLIAWALDPDGHPIQVVQRLSDRP
ncbi:MAG: VOC family protein [Nocardioidaceae bacterium]